MGDRKCDTAQALENSLQDAVRKCAEEHQVPVVGCDAQTQFGNLINAVSRNAPAVILVDEYDKPILNNISNPEIETILSVLKGFYSTIKTAESLEHFVFVTGVSKFCHVSLFSDLNNLTDITMNADYATMLGYTQREFETCFADRIAAAEAGQELPHDDYLKEIKDWYDGYRFHAKAETVYNPVSLASFFTDNGEFKNYWFSTGTPSFLLELIKKKEFDFEDALTRPVSEIAFAAYETDKIEPLALLLQTGYLTIKSSFVDFGATFYHLGFPNFEVRSVFDTYLLNAYTSISKDELEGIAVELARHVRSGCTEGIMKVFKIFLAAIPYDVQLKNEKYYQTVFFLLFLMLGVYIEAESRTNDGRIDAVAMCGEWVYLFEFKINQNAETALNQIREKEYFRKYQNSGKRIILIGANFNMTTRQLDDWKQEELKA